MNIIYLLPVVSDAHYRKRVRALEDLGAHSQILGFVRNHYEGKLWADGYTILGHIQNGKYFRRLWAMPKALSIIRFALKGSDVIYVFSLDTLLLAVLARWCERGKQVIAYELADLGLRTRHGLASRLIKAIESLLLRQTSTLVLTSDRYLTGYFQPIVAKLSLRCQIIENKLNLGEVARGSEVEDLSTTRPETSCLRIGYFGMLRCRSSWQILKELAQRGEGRIEVYMRGVLSGMEGIEDEIMSTEHVTFGGEYVSPDELPDLYSQVDMVWAAYRHRNYTLVRANRFYEACFYNRPMIGQSGTRDGEDIVKYQIGACVEMNDVPAAVQLILGISRESLSLWADNMAKLPVGVYTYTDEHRKLYEFLEHEIAKASGKGADVAEDS